jgi:hypothetical protein
MHPVYQFIPIQKVNFVDDYSQPEKSKTFTNIYFRTTVARRLKWQTNLAVEREGGQIINTSNKMFSFFSIVHFNPQFQDYHEDLAENYSAILNEPSENVIVVDEPVYQFFDLESVCGSGHSYDVTFHLLYRFFTDGHKCSLLIPESDNIYFQRMIKLIEDEFNVTFYIIKPGNTYLFKEFTCVRQYQNVYFPEVKTFINKRLIEPIVKRFDLLNTQNSDTVAKIKFIKNSSIFWPKEVFERTKQYNDLCASGKLLNLDEEFTEQEKIYYLNKASTIIVSWGSTFYINIHYYVADVREKFISVLFHKEIMEERSYIQTKSPGVVLHSLHSNSGNITGHIYDSFLFNGEVIDNLENIDDYLSKTILSLGKK